MTTSFSLPRQATKQLDEHTERNKRPQEGARRSGQTIEGENENYRQRSTPGDAAAEGVRQATQQPKEHHTEQRSSRKSVAAAESSSVVAEEARHGAVKAHYCRGSTPSTVAAKARREHQAVFQHAIYFAISLFLH